jgi:hypothetical protein
VSRPTARPIAQVSRPRKPRSGPGFPKIATRTDPPPARSSRISARQLERIAAGLNRRDRDVLAFVGAYRLVTGRQLVRRFWPEEDGDGDRQGRAGRRALKRLADWRVLDPLPGRGRGGTRGGSDSLIYALGVAGVRLLTLAGPARRRLGAPGDQHIAHTLAVAELAVRVFEADRAGEVECVEMQAEPECWRAFLGAMGSRIVVKPDLYLRVAAPGSVYEYRWFCEVDMATQRPSALLAKSRCYVSYRRSGGEQREHGVFPRVLWLVPDEHRALQIEGVLSELPLADRRLFTIWQFDDAAQYVSLEASK